MGNARANAQPPLFTAHVPALDGIRGLAIVWVMLFHMAVIPPIGVAAASWQLFCDYGGLGVDVFFALSGFLITGILLDSKGAPHYFRNFYARRVLRIFPLYYAIVFLSLIVLPHVTHVRAGKFEPAVRDAVWYWLHLSNFAIARRGAFVHGILDVSWSLSIEEQFYLVWPLAVWLVSRSRLRGVCLLLVAMSCVSRTLLASRGASPVAIYTLTFCRCDGLAIGALTASCIRCSRDKVRRLLQVAWVASLFLVAACLASAQFSVLKLFSTAFEHSAIALLTSCAIASVLTLPAGPMQRSLSNPLLGGLGRFSYGLYLFHYPLMAALRDRVLRPTRMPVVWGSSLPSQLAFDAIAIAITFLAALLSWHTYEKWFLRLKRHFGPRVPPQASRRISARDRNDIAS